jgi:50S ribosomal protein uL3
MAIGLVGRKCGMTRVFTDAGESVPVTVVEVLPNRVTQVKSVESDGYRAVQVTFGTRRPQLLTKSSQGHFAKANVEPGRGLIEFRLVGKDHEDLKLGSELKVDLFAEGQAVDVTGVTIGKGFAGVHEAPQFRRRHGLARRLGVAPRAGLDRPAPDAGPRVSGQAHVGPHGRDPPHHREPEGRGRGRQAQPAADPRRHPGR